MKTENWKLKGENWKLKTEKWKQLVVREFKELREVKICWQFTAITDGETIENCWFGGYQADFFDENRTTIEIFTIFALRNKRKRIWQWLILHLHTFFIITFLAESNKGLYV